MFILNDESKSALLEMFKPAHENIMGDKFELCYKPTCTEMKDLRQLFGAEFEISIKEYSEDENCQSVVVELPRQLQRFIQRCACIPISTSSLASVYDVRDLAERESWTVGGGTLVGSLRPVWTDVS